LFRFGHRLVETPRKAVAARCHNPLSGSCNVVNQELWPLAFRGNLEKRHRCCFRFVDVGQEIKAWGGAAPGGRLWLLFDDHGHGLFLSPPHSLPDFGKKQQCPTKHCLAFLGPKHAPWANCSPALEAGLGAQKRFAQVATPPVPVERGRTNHTEGTCLVFEENQFSASWGVMVSF